MPSKVFAPLALLWAVLLVTAASSATTSDPGADMPVWPFALGTVAAVGVAAIWQVRRRP